MTKGSHQSHNAPWDLEVDVAIAGAGGAGLAAAVEAVDTGADTIVFEKQPSVLDSSTALSAGMMSFAGTDIQEREGIQDSNELLHKDIMEVGEWKNEPRLVQSYVDNQLETYTWLTKLGVKWAGVSLAAGMSIPRAHSTDPLEAIRIMKETAERTGARLHFGAPVTGLITDTGKRVVGVRFVENAREFQVKARKGVIVAMGGFAHDRSRLSALDPRFGQVVATSGPGHMGDGLSMAEELGAYIIDTDYVKPSFGLHVKGTTTGELLIIFYLGAIIANRKGKRFVNESLPYKDIGMASLDQPDGVGFQVFDRKVYELGIQNAETFSAVMPPAYCTVGLDQPRIDLLVKAHTIEELASQMRVPPMALRETIDRYNSFVDKGRDEDFGRTTLSGSSGSIVKIDTPPFYAFETRSQFLATYAGLAVDEDMRVLTRDGIIPGLYAAGEIVGGFHGASYQTGTAHAKALIFGRIAGRNAAHAR